MRRNNPTITDKIDFDPISACKALYKALEGFGTDESVIIHTVASCSNKQRQQIKIEYINLYKKDLIKEFKSELKICLSFDFKQLLLSMFMTPTEHDAYRLKRSVKGIGTDEKTLVDVLLTISPEHLKAAKTEYLKTFGVSLKCDIADDTSGNFRKFVFPLSQGLRKTEGEVDFERAKDAAMRIDYTYTEYKGTEIPRFDFIGLCNCESFDQMKATFIEYEKITGKNIVDFIESEFNGDTSFGLKSAVKCSYSIPGFLAERLFKSLEKIPRDDDTIIRIIVSRSEIDLEDIKKEFEQNHKKTLEEKIKNQTSGCFKQLLLAIVVGNHDQE